ncbi:MAG: hypothetical protein EBS53_16565 [Bacteroidetes bacterium]|nr:hypothetical protein [Bacteroidota bacterium]
MRVEAVGSAAASSARQVGMEMWRMSMTQRLNTELQQRVSGRGQDPNKARRVEPAVKVEISDEVRRLQGN